MSICVRYLAHVEDAHYLANQSCFMAATLTGLRPCAIEGLLEGRGKLLNY